MLQRRGLDLERWELVAAAHDDVHGEAAHDAVIAALDGKPAGFLRSSGIGHASKSKIELGVAGKDGFFDDIKVWNAEPIGN